MMSCAAVDADPLQVGLKRLGYQSFRPGQREAVETLLAKRRLLLVAPTGGGKSLCYQLPAILLPGTALVISPLIALMEDQVQAATARGIEATFLASTLPTAQIRQRMARLSQGAYQLVYVAPERLGYDGFLSCLETLNISLIAVDEAHCISEWGHDFRPEYLKIGTFMQPFTKARLLACTATATPVVRDEILSRLGLPPQTPQIVRGFARPNLALRVTQVATANQRMQQTDACLAEALGGPSKGRTQQRGTAIVYAPTRKVTDEQAARLRQLGWQAQAYHAGLPHAVRTATLSAFSAGRLEVVVATNAFGMGIDRADVRAVVHLSPPGSLEAYYQEVGRAGRDGQKAVGLMCMSTSDLPLRRHLLIHAGQADTRVPSVVVEHKWQLFLELLRWAEGGSCRHDAILRYFGDESETLQGCGICDMCETLSLPNQASAEQVQLLVRKALSGVARIHGRFGLGLAIRLLRGMADPRLSRSGLDSVRTFGILKEHPESWLLALLRRCVIAGWVDFTGTDRPLAVLTNTGLQVMHGQRPARLVLPPTSQTSSQKSNIKDVANGLHTTTDAAPDNVLDATAERVFAALRTHRLNLARAQKVPPYVIASDRTLRDLATLRPRNIEELKLAHGIGKAKLERFGVGFLRVIAQSSG